MFKANLFKLNRNKRYNYTPRYYEGKTIENLYDFDSKFNKYRETYNANDLGKQWGDARLESRNRANRKVTTNLVDHHSGIDPYFFIYYRFRSIYFFELTPWETS